MGLRLSVIHLEFYIGITHVQNAQISWKFFLCVWRKCILLRWLVYLKLPYFSCFGDKNSGGARLQIDDVLSTSKQRKCFWNQIKAFFEWLPHPFKPPFSLAPLAPIKSPTPSSLFKGIRLNRRWRKWAICNIHELGTSRVWQLSEWLYNCLGYVLHNRHSQAPSAPNQVKPCKWVRREHPLPRPPPFFPNSGPKTNTAQSLKCAILFLGLPGRTKGLSNTSSSKLTELKCFVFIAFGVIFFFFPS